MMASGVVTRDQDQPIISVRGLAKRFGSQQIWDDLSLDVLRGEIIGIVGGSGQGKSVLLRVITGLVTPDTGTISVFGRDVRELSREEKVDMESRWGVLFQDGALFSSLTVFAEYSGANARTSGIAAVDHG